MPTISFHLDEDTPLNDADLKKWAAAKGKVWTAKLTEKDMKGDKISPTLNWKAEMITQLSKLGMSRDGLKLWAEKGKFSGKITEGGDYDLVLVANRYRLKLTYEITAPKVVAPPPEPPKISYGNPKIKAGCSDEKFQRKILSIALTEGRDKGHGPVEFLDGALHAHVTNTEGIAWFWKGKEMEVIAFGKKNNANKKQQRGSTGRALNTCQYDWTHSLK